MTQAAPKYRVLFVDDEQSILDGLRDLLRKYRHEWDMRFALGGAAALDELARAPFDVVISDMRMPMMDGATLLAAVKESYPACARIILSGHAEREAVVKALPVAHQFLNKPCEVELLRTVIGRACGLQRLLQDHAVRSVIGKLDKLPSVPRTYWELTRAAARSDVNITELALIVKQDPAMSVKVLQLVNSSYFGVARRVTSVQQAVAYLGVDLLKALALMVNAFGTDGGPLLPGFSLEELQQQSVRTAKLAKQIVRDPQRVPEVGTAAMIHDVGKIVLSLGASERYAQVIVTSAATGRAFHEVELSLLGLTHAEVGAFLLGSWGLPLSIVEAVAYHHTPSAVSAGDIVVLAAVHIADALIDHVTQGEPGEGTYGDVDMVLVERLGVMAELPHWLSLARETVAASA